jgi:hypothetical protein
MILLLIRLNRYLLKLLAIGVTVCATTQFPAQGNCVTVAKGMSISSIALVLS